MTPPSHIAMRIIQPMAVSTEEMRPFLKRGIEQTEKQLLDSIILSLAATYIGIRMRTGHVQERLADTLAQLCLQYAMLSAPSYIEACFYAHRAVELDPNITLKEQYTLPSQYTFVVTPDGIAARTKLPWGFTLMHQPKDLPRYNEFLNVIKQETHFTVDPVKQYGRALAREHARSWGE